MRLSVIIVNYNVQYFLEQCLHSVIKAGRGIEMEVFVVDNDSVDGSVEMVEKKFPGIKLIANKENKGFSRANNDAIKVSSGRYILLLNPDTVVQEDTFQKVLNFMDAHSDAGALGVKMIDGSGNFLPESKRGLPTPKVAFYKIFGLSALFPRSKEFGKYHLGFLDKNQINEVEILAGAFMLLRKEALDKTGLLDEDFFMYGEDIDLSYRIIKAGYKNYYFPETNIIHYKGESTKKTSINYVLVFYNAMIIFARKHFSSGNALAFSALIKGAVYLRAGVALLWRLLQRMTLPLCDAALLFAGMFLLKNYWSDNFNVNYPHEYLTIAVPLYIFTWLVSVFFAGGYDKPLMVSKILRGLFTGSVFVLVVYALLPEQYRYSRALLLLGMLWAAASMLSLRWIFSLLGIKSLSLNENARKRLVIAGDEEEGNRVLSLLKITDSKTNFIGYINPSHDEKSGSEEYKNFLLGSISKLDEIVRIYKVDEIIFCARNISASQIISSMSLQTGREIEYKIAPPESLFIIGSSSVDNPGELYIVDMNSITKSSNRRNKRLFDVLFSLAFLFFSPILVLLQKKNHLNLFINVFQILIAKKTWVSYTFVKQHQSLPKLKKGVLTPADAIRDASLSEQDLQRLNIFYAKDYKVGSDLTIVLSSLRSISK